ncbi:MAG: Arc family DNA-binding protein [Terriglobales bacterium]
MPTLYVENIPDELYESLREYARKHRRSIAAEILTMLEERFPSERELKKRRRVFRQLEQLRAKTPLSAGPFPSTEQMQREDRER